MSTTSTVVLVLGFVGTILVIGVAIWRAAVRVRAAYKDAARSLERFQPALDRLEQTSAVTREELDRVEAAVAQLRDHRDARRDRRRIGPDPEGPRG